MELPNLARSASEISKKLDALFEKLEFRQLAQQQGMVVRERKITAEEFIRLCVLTPNLTLSSLENLCTVLSHRGISISKQALDERFCDSAVRFLEQVVQILTEQSLSNAKLSTLDVLSAVYIGDATSITLPESLSSRFCGCGGNGSTAGVKLFFEYDLKNSRFKQMNIYSASENDYESGQLSIDQLQGRELILRDLGFYKLDCFEQITAKGAFFLSRYKTGTNLYFSPGKQAEKISLRKIVRAMTAETSKELLVYVGTNHRIPCRLIIERFDQQTAAQRRRKLKENKQIKGETVSSERLDLSCCNCYITNLPIENFPLEDIRKIYSLRWQIEIIFKAWKSVFGIDKIKTVNPNRVLCFFYGKLIAILLSTSLFLLIQKQALRRGVHLSEFKGLARIIIHLEQLIHHLLKNTPSIKSIKFFVRLLFEKARKERKQGKNSAIDNFNFCLS